ncbi:MAG: hypothetical protein MSD68_15930 [Blautia sp.]|uniref:hypothetical protein n=1 Tax=Blautia sp. TaxID=1955243 RepID=UPI0025C4EEA1|nr:hypothetical protein [Blautia sp.]MCI7451146.1 hypothetical protein [Blautia sp.]
MEFLEIKEVEESEIRTLEEQEIRLKNACKWMCQYSICLVFHVLIWLFIPTGYSFVGIVISKSTKKIIEIVLLVLTFIVTIILFRNINRQNAKEIKELRKSKIYRYTVKISDAVTYSNLDTYVDLVAIDKLKSIFQMDSEYNKEEIIKIASGIDIEN